MTARFPLLEKVLKLFAPKKVVKDAIEHRTFAIERVEQRMRSEVQKPDFLSYILAHNKEKECMSRDEIHRNANTFIAAGSQTSATFLNAATWFMSNHPNCLKKLRTELEGAAKSNEDLSLQNLNNLKYFHAFINEIFVFIPLQLSDCPVVLQEKAILRVGAGFQVVYFISIFPYPITSNPDIINRPVS